MYMYMYMYVVCVYMCIRVKLYAKKRCAKIIFTNSYLSDHHGYIMQLHVLEVRGKIREDIEVWPHTYMSTHHTPTSVLRCVLDMCDAVNKRGVHKISERECSHEVRGNRVLFPSTAGSTPEHDGGLGRIESDGRFEEDSSSPEASAGLYP